jgi:putative chitinase
VYPTPEQYRNLIKLAQVMDFVRNRIGKPLRVTSALRPPRYNELIKGSPTSAHCEGRACDFQPVTMAIDEARFLLESQLEHLDIRMEDASVSPTWIHIDTRKPLPGHSRIFKP